MNRSIPETISANQLDLEQCKKFLAGNRSCFYRGFWTNTPYKDSPKAAPSKAEAKSKNGQN